MALDDAERARRYRARRKEGVPAVRYRRPAERHTRPQRWAEAVRTLNELLDDYEQWRDSLPASLAESVTADRLDTVLELRELVEQLQMAELPLGFGRD